MSALGDADGWRLLFESFPALWVGLTAFMGAVAASFGGVVVHRLPRMIGWIRPTMDAQPSLCAQCGAPAASAAAYGQSACAAQEALSLMQPSRCDSCGVRLSALALIPVLGWLLHRGSCRNCRSRVSAVYPSIEAATAVLSGATALYFGPTELALWALGALWTAVVLSWIDWRECLLPDAITTPLILAGLLASPFEPEPLLRIQGLVLSLITLWAAFWLVGRLKGVDTMSLGDLMLAAAAGAWLGLALIPTFLAIAAAVYLAYATPLRLQGRLWVPMGPALCAALVSCLWLGPYAAWI